MLGYLGDFQQRLTPYQGAKPAREFEDYLADRLGQDSQPQPIPTPPAR